MEEGEGEAKGMAMSDFSRRENSARIMADTKLLFSGDLTAVKCTRAVALASGSVRCGTRRVRWMKGGGAEAPAAEAPAGFLSSATKECSSRLISSTCGYATAGISNGLATVVVVADVGVGGVEAVVVVATVAVVSSGEEEEAEAEAESGSGGAAGQKAAGTRSNSG